MKPAQAAESLGWQLVRQLGEGGQGDVSLAVRKDKPNAEQYVFKLLKERSTGKARQRFRQELQAITRIDHPGIVKVIEHAEEDNSVQYYVMEYVPGLENLRKRIERGSNPFFKDPLKAINGFAQITEALAACEKLRIVHRDLSPANLLVSDDGKIKLIDFGLCHTDDGQTITLTEEAVGTPLYRAPECSGHWQGDPDIRADLYSAGKLLWTMITNKTAFDREQPVFSNLALSRVLPDLPMSWHMHHVFEFTIRQSPGSRFANAETAAAAAKDVRRLIISGYKPLEQLADMLCPQCGVGRYDGARAVEAAFDEQMQKVKQILAPLKGTYAICPFCFHVSFVAMDALHKVLAERAKLL